MNRVNKTAQRPPDGTWMGKAFHLACFIHGHLSEEEQRRAATRIATEALSQLPVTATKRKNRLRYLLKGQIFRSSGAKTTKGKVRSKINLERIHLLQCLVFKESEGVERIQEEAASGAPLDQEAMLVRYLAYVVRTTMEHSSFYVNLALCRFVYSYNAGETEGLYNLVIQHSPDRYKDGGYFRKRKEKLIKDIRKRFGARLTLVEGSHGEKRFQRVERPEEFLELLHSCLVEFQPWEVECCLPVSFNQYDPLPMLSSDSRQDDDSAVELRRIHSLLHPNCFGKLVKALRYEEPGKRLGLPLFV